MTEGVGSIFRRLRTEQDQTLEGVADGASVHRNTLGRIERGEGYPTVPVAVRIARQLGHRLSLIPADVVCDGEIEIDGANGETAA